MKTALRHLFNYWLPPGVNDTSPVLNPIVDLAVRINASCLAMLSGGEIDWDEIKQDSEEWAKLVEMARQPPPVPYVLAHGHYRGSEMSRVNEEWAKKTERVIRREALIELTRLSEEMGGYAAFDKQLRQCETTISRVLLAPATEAGPKSTSPSADQTLAPSTETKC